MRESVPRLDNGAAPRLAPAAIPDHGDKMHRRSNSPKPSRLRAPQFAATAVDESDHARDAQAPSGGVESPWVESTIDSTTDATMDPTANPGPGPQVTVRRKKQLALPVEGSPHAAEAEAEAEVRERRVFVVPRAPETPHETDLPSAERQAPCEDSAASAEAEPAATPAASGGRERISRRRAPDYRRAGRVTVIRPDADDPTGAPAGTDRSLASLQAELAGLTQTLDELRGGMPSLDLDLTINLRWARIDEALESLRESVGTRARFSRTWSL